MAVLYIKEQGAYVKKADNHLSVEKNGQKLADFPLHKVSDVSIIGNVQITTQALHLLMEEGIDVSFFTYSGKMIGQVAADSSKNIFLRFAQYELYQNIEERLNIAKIIVANKITNQILVIKNFNWDGVDYDYHDEVKQLNNQLKLLDKMRTANEIMGIEGVCSAIYFTSFAHMFKCKIKFEGRNRRPPKDPINIILSLAYTLLTKEVCAALDSESFETYLGFLHGIRYGRKSLSLDIVEEFRQPAVDRLVLLLFNKHMISEIDFEEQDERIVLTEDGFKKFCREYEKWMKAPVSKHETRSFRAIIRDQVAGLKRAIKQKESYHPYEWRGDNVYCEL